MITIDSVWTCAPASAGDLIRPVDKRPLFG